MTQTQTVVHLEQHRFVAHAGMLDPAAHQGNPFREKLARRCGYRSAVGMGHLLTAGGGRGRLSPSHVGGRRRRSLWLHAHGSERKEARSLPNSGTADDRDPPGSSAAAARQGRPLGALPH